MAFVAIYDACVLYPSPLRDVLLRLAQKGLVRARWTETILDECFRSILKNRPDLDSSRLARTRELMNGSVADCLVREYEMLIPSLSLPDPDDRHVLAAAIRCGAQTIVTFNLSDFPVEVLSPLGVEPQHPDDFLVHQIHLDQGAVVGTVEQQASALKNPPHSIDDVLDGLERLGLVQSVALLRGIVPR